MLELSAVSAGYRRGESVIRAIDLEVERGRLVALLGANGCGQPPACCGRVPAG
jgi:ABC-type branched-subunit amino acid transport system ATPase component